MPTKHRRIAIVRDAEVEAALARARRALADQGPDASLAKDLVVRGAEAVTREASPQDELSRILRERYGATYASGKLGESLDRLGPVDEEAPHRATEILRDLRRERA